MGSETSLILKGTILYTTPLCGQLCLGPLDPSGYQQLSAAPWTAVWKSPSWASIWSSLAWDWLTGVSFNCECHLCESFKCSICLLASFWCISPRLQLSLPPIPALHQHYDFFISSVNHRLQIKCQKETGGSLNKLSWMSIWRNELNPNFQQDHSQTAKNSFCYQHLPQFPQALLSCWHTPVIPSGTCKALSKFRINISWSQHFLQ